MPIYRTAVLAAAAMLCGGCGTFTNLGCSSAAEGTLGGKYEVYGGVKFEVDSAYGMFARGWANEDNRGTCVNTPESGLIKQKQDIPAQGTIISASPTFDSVMRDVMSVPIVVGFFAVDFPLTVIGDTLTLPLTIPRTLNQKRNLPSTETTTAPDGGK